MELDQLAAPDEFSAALPSTVEPLKKRIVPVGAPEVELETVAERTTAWPTVETAGETASSVVEVAGAEELMVSDTLLEAPDL